MELKWPPSQNQANLGGQIDEMKIYQPSLKNEGDSEIVEQSPASSVRSPQFVGVLNEYFDEFLLYPPQTTCEEEGMTDGHVRYEKALKTIHEAGQNGKVFSLKELVLPRDVPSTAVADVVHFMMDLGAMGNTKKGYKLEKTFVFNATEQREELEDAIAVLEEESKLIDEYYDTLRNTMKAFHGHPYAFLSKQELSLTEDSIVLAKTSKVEKFDFKMDRKVFLRNIQNVVIIEGDQISNREWPQAALTEVDGEHERKVAESIGRPDEFEHRKLVPKKVPMSKEEKKLSKIVKKGVSPELRNKKYKLGPVSQNQQMSEPDASTPNKMRTSDKTPKLISYEGPLSMSCEQDNSATQPPPGINYWPTSHQPISFPKDFYRNNNEIVEQPKQIADFKLSANAFHYHHDTSHVPSSPATMSSSILQPTLQNSNWNTSTIPPNQFGETSMETMNEPNEFPRMLSPIIHQDPNHQPSQIYHQPRDENIQISQKSVKSRFRDGVPDPSEFDQYLLKN